MNPAKSGSRVWLHLRDDEVEPQVVESAEDSRVVWSSLWPNRPEDQVLLEVARSGSDTLLTFTLLAVQTPPDEDTTGYIRHRINHLLYADLRYSYGQ